ncbi:DUF3566 domain-containing protein [Acaricomes phytoseiuli]|uniref:DUF3566 domain-containing protein n=1 Tax=Acaricomes phytoseiuli TaxID=291968 RepID=UPI0003811545|nr:DUF3566 domain-containing protein [Acaricomes phytoseiuli]MCW1248666.1 DUF3566 domain-containing protein [Acaricomes phytoseiuli]
MSSNNSNASAAKSAQPVKPQQRPAASKTAESSPRPALVKPAPATKARQARLQVSRVEPWSVLKLSFLLSVALGIVIVVAAIVLWSVLDLTGVFGRINSILAGGTGSGFDIRSFASLGQVASFATIVAVVNVVLLTALAMLSAVLYNISATLVGGIGVTLTDD